MMAAALDVAEQAMTAGELPIAAVVALGDEIVGFAHTQDQRLGRRIVHADLLAMIAADERLGWTRRSAPLALAVTLEPCVMCLGAAMVLGVSDVYYGLDSPADGGSPVAASSQTHPTMPWFTAPRMTSGVLRDRVQDQFRRYLGSAAEESGFTRWAQSVLSLNKDAGPGATTGGHRGGFALRTSPRRRRDRRLPHADLRCLSSPAATIWTAAEPSLEVQEHDPVVVSDVPRAHMPRLPR